MHQTLFTCSHIGNEELHRVHWLRFAVAKINPHSSHKRIRHRNKNFTFIITPCEKITIEHSLLHQQYRASIDFDGALSIEEALWGDEAIGESIFTTKCISVYHQGKLVAAGYFDVGLKTAASILHFYHPDFRRFSLGKYLILLTIDYLKKGGYEYYYPGYLVENVPKMNYKLFLGKETAEYFEPVENAWKKFDPNILTSKHSM